MHNVTADVSTVESSRPVSSWNQGTKKWGIPSAVTLVGWTLFVWVGRIRNVVLDDELAGLSKLWRASLALSFVVIALITGGLLLRAVRQNRSSQLDGPMNLARKAAGVLAVYGIVVWAIRGTDIFLGSHSVAFIVVHTVLAVVTLALGVIVLQRFVRGESVTISE